MPKYSKCQLACHWKSFEVLQNYSPHSSPFFFFLNVSEAIPDILAHYPTCSPSRPHQPYNDNSKRRSSFNYLYPNRNRSRLTCINPSNTLQHCPAAPFVNNAYTIRPENMCGKQWACQFFFDCLQSAAIAKWDTAFSSWLVKTVCW